MSCRLKLLIAFAAAVGLATAAPRHVLVFFPLPLGRPETQAILRGLLNAINTELPAAVEVHAEFVTGQAKDLGWLAPKYEGRPLDLIVALNYQSVATALAYRGHAGKPVPILTVINPHDLHPDQPAGPGIAGLEIDLRPAETIRTALAVVPDAEHFAVIGGASATDRATHPVWLERVKSQAPRIDVIDLSNLSLEELQRRVARLPPRTVCLLANFETDAAGRPISKPALTQALVPHSNAPIFDHVDPSFGLGTVGGWMVSADAAGARAGEVAARLLKGEPVQALTRIVPATYRFDSRQLRRWGIPESRLPQGSAIDFREPTLWDRYRSWLLAAFGALATLLALLAYLLVDRWWRARSHTALRAELAGTRRLQEISHWNRLSALGQLTSSLAHEINQPISAILANAEAVRVMVRKPQPDTRQIGEALLEMQSAGQRASAVIENLRALLRKNPSPVTDDVELTEVVRETVQLVAHDASRRAVQIDVDLAAEPNCVRIGRTQLQQVILNLLSNALDAAEAAPAPRWVRVRTWREANSAAIEVSDSGAGVLATVRASLFEPFHTTKPHGLGVGLAISQAIVTAAHGRIVLERSSGPGAVFRITLPAVRS